MNKRCDDHFGGAPEYPGTGGLHVRMPRYLVFTFLLALLLNGCAFQMYDPKKPDGYWHYWQDENNVRNSALYPLATDRGEAGRSRR